MPRTRKAVDNTSLPVPTAEEDKGSSRLFTSPFTGLTPIEMTKHLKELYVLHKGKRIEVAYVELEALNRMRAQNPKVSGVPVYFSCYPHHLVLWPTPDHAYELEVVHAG